MDRYPPEHPPEECDFYQGLRLVTRAYWDNSDGVGEPVDEETRKQLNKARAAVGMEPLAS